MTQLTFEEELKAATEEDGNKDFPFAKSATGDPSGDQPNQDPNNPRSGKKVSEPQPKKPTK
jgi:hypothetical protein